MENDASRDTINVVISPNQSHVSTDRFGTHRKWSHLDGWEKSFLVVSTLNILLCVGISVYRLVVVVREGTNNLDFTFTILLIINSVFCLFYVIHGLLMERRFEIYVFICAVVFVIGYCVVHYFFRGDISLSKTVRVIAASTLGPLSIVLAVKVISGFGWVEFQILGASQHLQGMFCSASWFSSLIKLDLQVAISFLVLVLNNDVIRTINLVIMSVGVFISILWTFLGRASVRNEWKTGAVLFSFIGLLAPAYVLFVIICNYIDIRSYDDNKPAAATAAAAAATAAEESHLQLVFAYSMLLIGALFILVRSVVYIELVEVYRNFGEGLRERAFDEEANERSSLLARS